MMKRQLGSSFSTLRGALAAASVLALALAGCGGGGGNNNNSSSSSDGGGTEPPPTQDSGVVVEGDPGSAITLPTNPTVNADAIVAKNAVLDMSQTASFANGKLSVHFFLKDADNADDNTNGISLTENSCDFRALASQLTDNTTDQDPGPGWHQVDTDSAGFGELDTLTGLLTVIDGTTGEYSYTFADDGNFPAERHEYAGGGIAAAMADPNNTLRATLIIRCNVDVDGKTLLTVNPVSGSYDFSTGDPGTELTDSGAEIVSSAACFTCHGPTLAGLNDSGLDQETDHGRYTDVETCNQCHALNSYVDDQNTDLAPFIHSIHSGQPSQENGGGAYQSRHDFAGAQFGPVGYPQNLWTCAKCHADGTAVDTDHPDGEGGPVASEADLAYSNPTRRACGGCHSNVNFETGENHSGPRGNGGSQTSDQGCVFCHPASGVGSIGGSVREVHDLGPLGDDPSVQPEFSVAITMDTPERGYYIAGDRPTVTVTLTPIDGGPDVDYTVGPDEPGALNGVLTRADLFVYGPRSRAVPVLTTCSTTDPGFTDTPQSAACDGRTDPLQSHSLFMGSTINGVTDDRVKTDASGFKYQLMAVGQVQPGTYLVRFGGADTGDHDSDLYTARTASTKVIQFQVGTATEEPKVSGDGCLNCHGDTAFHFEPGSHGTHTSPFDTDYCLACHDYTTNHADYIGNRVHAIHHETFSGDFVGGSRIWTHVSFPQQSNNCSICHTNSDAAVPVWRSTEPLACGGCHGTDPDAVANAEAYLAGNPDITEVEAEKVMLRAPKEATAASHMLSMMAVPGGTRDDFFTYGSEPVAGCLVCHGAGQPQDLYQAMGLAMFGIPVDTSNTE
jgi:OmcA/MtrC family decaheme c-type cytochrome